MKTYKAGLLLGSLAFFATVTWCSASPKIIQEGDKTYIVDLHGERWDVTQAESEGFEPDNFQYGIGRYAFTPLDDSFLTDQTQNVDWGLRVIGISNTESKAYSVSKLRGHEIANSWIGSKPIAVAY